MRLMEILILQVFDHKQDFLDKQSQSQNFDLLVPLELKSRVTKL